MKAVKVLGPCPWVWQILRLPSQYRSDWGVCFAGLVLVLIPTLIFYILLQRHIVKGVAAGALKG